MPSTLLPRKTCGPRVLSQSIDRSPLLSFLSKASPALLRAPAGLLRHPFIVPGAIYCNELWDWDSYWTTCGLLEIARRLDDKAMRLRMLDYGKGSLFNLLEHQGASGAIPIMMREDNPDVFGCLNECGPEVNQAKPILAQFALRLADESGDSAWLQGHFDSILGFLRHWGTKYRSHNGLLVWGSDVGIGVDNDPCAYGRPDFSAASLLLNCLFAEDLQAAAILAARLGRDGDAERLQMETDNHRCLIQKICWDSRDEFFYSQDVQCADHRAEKIPWAAPGMPMAWSSLPIRIQGFTGFLPLWCGAATQEQAEVMRKHLANAKTFGSNYGPRSLSKQEPMYSLAQSCNPSNWLGPIWIVANYFVWKGLLRYGFEAEAAILARKTVSLLEDDARKTGTLHEYYHPETGEPLMNPGFLSWNLLALEMDCGAGQ